ncbi:hypothetical protein PI125_g18811 [Phytophthora idaei]|nr:hypothetical protein PI125_g18811 [Phytophthora idaei]
MRALQEEEARNAAEHSNIASQETALTQDSQSASDADAIPCAQDIADVEEVDDVESEEATDINEEKHGSQDEHESQSSGGDSIGDESEQTSGVSGDSSASRKRSRQVRLAVLARVFVYDAVAVQAFDDVQEERVWPVHDSLRINPSELSMFLPCSQHVYPC